MNPKKNVLPLRPPSFFLLVLAVFWSLSTTSCWLPMNLSDACKEQISECLKDCPERPPSATDRFRSGRSDLGKSDGNDDSSASAVCERHCYALCSK